MRFRHYGEGRNSLCRMGNVLRREKREQVIALGRLGWSLRRIEEATGVRRETVRDYLRKAGVVIRLPGSWGEKSLAKAAALVTTGSSESAPAKSEYEAKPATQVITGFLAVSGPFSRAAKTSASACADYQELIEAELRRGRNAMGIWQDLVDRHAFASGYQSVQRFVRSLRGASSPQARVIIETLAGVVSRVFRTFDLPSYSGRLLGLGCFASVPHGGQEQSD